MKKALSVAGCVLVLLSVLPLSAQEKGQPGKFDFYLLNLSWAPEFCAIQGTSPHCAAHGGFLVHGLWPQNNDGSYPVFCAVRPGPANPWANLDITPDLSLLKHEWDKHGTCTTLSPNGFFADEHKAFHLVAIPPMFESIDHELQMAPADILEMFRAANPEFPPGSILLSCENNRLTAVEVCMTKDLKPMACKGLKSCGATTIMIAPPETVSSPGRW